VSELTFTLLRFGYLALLWVFIFVALAVIRRDLKARRSSDYSGSSAGSGSGTTAASGGQPPAPRYAPASLHVIAGPLTGASIPLDGGTVLLGRAPGNTLQLEDDYASSRHARVFVSDGALFLEDLNSTNGTFIGDDDVHGVVPLSVGTQFRIGRTIVEVR
jgi:pSer/pThr/pTyr-binding forkhead associated (FHA) protein